MRLKKRGHNEKEAPHLPNAFSLLSSFSLDLIIDSVLKNANIKVCEYFSTVWVCLIGFLSFAIFIKVV